MYNEVAPVPERLVNVGIMGAFKRLLGLLCVAVAAVLSLFALFGFLTDKTGEGRTVAAVIGGAAILLLVIGLRFLRQKDGVVAKLDPRGSPGHPTRQHTGLRYEDFRFGDPPPSRKQFGYAMALGVVVEDGMTKWMLSDAIDEAIESLRAAEPATKEQLQTIKSYHGVLPRAVTRGEARQIIEFLEDYTFPCPFCKAEVLATDDECCGCGKSLRRVRIPIKL